MYVVIAGIGKVGRTLVEQLILDGHEVVAIDPDEGVLEHLSAAYDVMTVCGSGASRNALNEAGISKSSLMISSTGTDEMNILGCMIARRLGARHTVARVRNTEYFNQLEFMRDNLGLSMTINPELIAAREIFGTLRFPAAQKIEYFSRGKVQLVEFKLEHSQLDGIKLSEFYRKYQLKILVGTVLRDDHLTIPNGDFVLHNGDTITVAGSPSEVERFFRAIGALRSGVRSAMLIGGSRISYYLARMLCNSGVELTIVDKDHDRCMQLSEMLPGATVIEGNGADHELLAEEGISRTDAFVSLTGIDEENIILSLYAKTQGVNKVITKVNSTDLRTITGGLGLDSIISPHDLTANHILRYARSLQNALGSNNVETLYKLSGGRAEAVEFRVKENIPGLTGIPLRDLTIKRGILVASITHNEEVIVPLGDDMIRPGDRVIIISDDRRISDITDILA